MGWMKEVVKIVGVLLNIVIFRNNMKFKVFSFVDGW